ncbi:hypothetical protein Tco_1203917 [Tanacetum coccineum]
MELISMLDLGCSSLLQKIDLCVYDMENMIKHTENSFLSLLFIVSKNEMIRRIERGSLIVDWRRYAVSSLLDTATKEVMGKEAEGFCNSVQEFNYGYVQHSADSLMFSNDWFIKPFEENNFKSTLIHSEL